MLFRVHSYFFTRESKTFHNKVYPAGPGVTRQGTSDRDPIRLSNVSPDEFETFLFVFYNPSVIIFLFLPAIAHAIYRRYSVYENTVDQWKVILKFAQEWNFDEVKELAVRELHKKEELSVVERLALYQDHQVDPRHLIPLYSLFCERDTPLTVSESKILGFETTVLIASMREKLRAQPSSDGRSPLPNSIDKNDIYRNFEKEIGIGLGSTEKFQKELGFPPVQVLSPICKLRVNHQ